MTACVNYIIEANLGLLVFLGGRRLLLARETDFRFQRMLLLTGMVASGLFPQKAEDREGNGEPVRVSLGTITFNPFSRLREVVVIGYALK